MKGISKTDDKSNVNGDLPFLAFMPFVTRFGKVTRQTATTLQRKQRHSFGASQHLQAFPCR